jgi:hypothetical protein
MMFWQTNIPAYNSMASIHQNFIRPAFAPPYNHKTPLYFPLTVCRTPDRFNVGLRLLYEVRPASPCPVAAFRAQDVRSSKPWKS